MSRPVCPGLTGITPKTFNCLNRTPSKTEKSKLTEPSSGEISPLTAKGGWEVEGALALKASRKETAKPRNRIRMIKSFSDSVLLGEVGIENGGD